MNNGHLPDNLILRDISSELIVDGSLCIPDNEGCEQIVAGVAFTNPADLFVIIIPDRDRKDFGQAGRILVCFGLQLAVQIVGLPAVYEKKQDPLYKEYQQYQTDGQFCGDGPLPQRSDSSSAESK